MIGIYRITDKTKSQNQQIKQNLVPNSVNPANPDNPVK
jgi:hypothetical protein